MFRRMVSVVSAMVVASYLSVAPLAQGTSGTGQSGLRHQAVSQARRIRRGGHSGTYGSGTSGAAGSSGMSGNSGMAGSSGMSGNSGATGTAGTSGTGAASGSAQGTTGYPDTGQNSRGGTAIGWIGLLGLAGLLGLRRRSASTPANMNR